MKTIQNSKLIFAKSNMSTTKEAKGIKIDGKDVKIPSEEILKKVIIETIQYFSKPGMSQKKTSRSNVSTKRRF